MFAEGNSICLCVIGVFSEPLNPPPPRTEEQVPHRRRTPSFLLSQRIASLVCTLCGNT
jgi:hypothetical protein